MIHIPQFFEELEALEAKGDYAFKLSSLLVPYLMKMKEPEMLIKKQSCSKQWLQVGFRVFFPIKLTPQCLSQSNDSFWFGYVVEQVCLISYMYKINSN